MLESLHRISAITIPPPSSHYKQYPRLSSGSDDLIPFLNPLESRKAQNLPSIRVLDSAKERKAQQEE
jgi:hypothetical protein